MRDMSGTDDIIREFFPELDPDQLRATLINMHYTASLGQLAMLPRTELAQRAYVAEQFEAAVQRLWEALIAEWGDDPADWQLPPTVRRSIGRMLAIHFAGKAPDHSAPAGVQPTGHVVLPARRRGRSGN